jgi:PBP1b-binding outer membrane lipoprotein LpoB
MEQIEQRMKPLLLVLLLSGCATAQHNSASPNHAIQPLQVDCRYGNMMLADLEAIISNPQIENPTWQGTFATISGNQTAIQRTQSAKVVLWTIRTQCQGF